MTKQFLFIAAILLIIVSGLFGNQDNEATFERNQDIPKSYDYVLTPGGTETINGVLAQIQARFHNNEKNVFSVGLSNGVYQDQVYFPFSAISNDSVFTDLYIAVVGLGTSVHILGDNLIIVDEGNLHFMFNNLDISGGQRGIEALYLSGAMMFLTVENCKVHDFSGSNTGLYENMDGIGIYSEGPANIRGCQIYNNTGVAFLIGDGNIVNFSRGGGISIKNNTSDEAIVQNCIITNNVAMAGGGIYATGSGQITIKDNTIQGNSRNYYEWGGQVFRRGSGEGIYCYACDKLTIQGNIVKNQFDSYYYRVGIGSSAAIAIEVCGDPLLQTVLIENNTMMDNENCHGLWVSYPWGKTLIRNNLSCNNRIGIYCSDYTSNRITVAYNVAYQNAVLNQSDPPANFVNSLPTLVTEYNNGEFDPMVNSQYAPIWNSTIMSPLIDSGDPECYDNDETRSDIGAIPTGDHKLETYVMPVSSENSGIKWMSFPVLNEVTNGYCMNGNFFEPILDRDLLNLIRYKPYNSGIRSIYWYVTLGDWTNLTDVVNSLQGYQIYMPNADEQIKFNTSGYLQAPTTIIPLNHGENWIGYFCKDSSKPLDAFASILSKISWLKTQNWAIVKQPDGTWFANGAYTLNYGDMVMLDATEGCSFSWNNNQPVDPKNTPKSQAFTYTEKLDYTPFFISIPEAKTDDMPSEIGLYVNGVCKGAVVVEDNDPQICAYLDEGEQITPDNSSLVFYYPAKAAPHNKSVFRVQPDQLSMQENPLPYYMLQIDDLGSVMPVSPAIALSQNYPNPFNPNTTISYELPEDGRVALYIYNVKGQLVTKLVDSLQSIGAHSVIWNGRDSNGAACASGIYYYKITSNNISITKKMLMIK